eukprot:gnl/TRDRNA2_/TRDRNA2_116488_c0_seq1.p1 gnl/TRDRNA2_/TRDRNA2_116488_c0~~gnl/TRDRNA2_/TRDRNA2_116488_c0_seq1.p1  ORF type:complete len:358 (-),score=42.83 gnl/TRDRNA2_/TRDRNA2_116488_c0_seq1:98-1171(-)
MEESFSSAPPAAARSKSGANPNPYRRQVVRETRILEKKPNEIKDPCGACATQCMAGASGIEFRLGPVLRQTTRDFFDFWLSPTAPGPLHVTRREDARRGFSGSGWLVSDRGGEGLEAAGEAVDRSHPSQPSRSRAPMKKTLGGFATSEQVDRIVEFRLCLEMLREGLSAYEADAASGLQYAENLSSAEAALEAVEETLRRIAEVSLGHRLLAHSDTAKHDTALLTKIVRSPSFRNDGFRRCLVGSGLGVSGFLEAALGELSNWGPEGRPTAAERQTWQQWDGLYERLVRNAQQERRRKLSTPGFKQAMPAAAFDSIDSGAGGDSVCCLGPGTTPVHVVECLESRCPAVPCSISGGLG